MIAADRRGDGKRRRRRKPAGSTGPTAHLVKWTRRADHAANRGLERAYPALRRAGRSAGSVFDRAISLLGLCLAWTWTRLRRPASFLFRGMSWLELLVRRICRGAARAATAVSTVITPRRAAGATIAAAGLCLVASQFLDYRGVEIGQPGYTDLPAVAKPPTVDVRTAGDAHAYLLVPVGILAALLGLACARRERPRLALGSAALGLLALAVILAIDLPSGLDVGAQSARFAEASAVLEDGFFAELAAAGGMVLAGLLYYARPCRIRISSSGRAASARRRRPRRRASSRARVARSA